MTTAAPLTRHELIGMNVRVMKSSNPTHVGIVGSIIDETMNTVVIDSVSGKKRLPKDILVLGFALSDGTLIEIDGKQLDGRPADRIGKKYTR